MADLPKASKHFKLAHQAAVKGDSKSAAHHAGHGLSALRDRVSGSGFAGSPMQPQKPVAPKVASAPPIQGGEPDVFPDSATPVPVQTGNGLMARLRSFGKKPVVSY